MWNSLRSGVRSAPLWFAFSATALALQAGTDRPLDEQSALLGVHSSSRPDLALGGGDDLHAVWQDLRGATWQTYYRRSPDFGQSFDPAAIQLSSWGNIKSPKVATDRGNGVFVVWQAFASDEERIYLSRSLDGGLSFQPEVQLNLGPASYADTPQVCADALGNVYVVWIQTEALTTPQVFVTDQVYITLSHDSGATWSTPAIVNTNPPTHGVVHQFPHLACSDNGRVYVAYGSNRNGNNDVFFRGARGFGTILAPTDEQLNSNTTGNAWLSMAVNGTGMVIVGWSDNGGVYASHSTNFGNLGSWQAQQTVNAAGTAATQMDLAVDSAGNAYGVYRRFTAGPPIDIYANALDLSTGLWGTEQLLDPGVSNKAQLGLSQIASDGSKVCAVWMRTYAGFGEHLDLFLSWTGDQGSTWSTPSQLNSNPAMAARSRFHQLVAGNGRAGIVWDDRRFWTVPGALFNGHGAPEVFFNSFTTP
jgi:hypothetical protein